MNKKIGASVFAALLLALAAAWYFWPQTPAEPVAPVAAPQAITPDPVAPTLPEAPPLAVLAPVIRYPLGAMPELSTLPELGQSDTPFFSALGAWLDRRLLVLFFSDEMIRRIVKTVDNLPRQQLPPDTMPLKPVPGAFVTAGKLENLTSSGRNTARYAGYIRVMRRIDAGKVVGIYIDFYPLFQKAYAELSNSNAYFNDRLVEAIDDMLAAPVMAGPVKLVRKDNYFAFADPLLEARSAGQKILLRVGPANATAIKAKLCEIREKVTQHAGQLAESSVCLQIRRSEGLHPQ